MKRKLKMLFACFIIGAGIATAQTSAITGIVFSSEDGEPIIGASILIEGYDNLGGTTDLDGKFVIANVPSSAKTLRVTYVGMKSASLPILRGKQMRIQLAADVQLLDDVVVTAMGITRSEKALGYSATKVSAEDLTISRTANVTTALSGKVAGLQVQATSSDPGAANSIVIRGFSSINGNNQPLYVVDGVPLQNSSITASGHTTSLGGISNVSSEDIESMTILKGAAATALYGSRASNGVVVITTKSGKKGEKRGFNINYNGGVQARQISYLPEMQNSFGQGWNGAQTYIENGSWGPRLDGSTQVYGPIWNNQQLIHDYTAKVNNVRDFFDLGWSQNHNVALSGASTDNKMTYYMSYSHTDDDGIMPTNADNYKRNTLAMRNSFDAAKWLKVSSSVNVATASTDVVGSFQGTSVIDGLLEMPRDVSIVDMRDLSNAFNTPEAYYTPYGITNPYWSLANNYNHTDSKQVYGKLQADLKPVNGLTLSYRYGFDYTDYDMKMGSPQIALDDALINEDYGYAPSNMNQDGYVYARYSRSYEQNHDFLANYSNKFIDNKFDVNVNAGVNLNERASTYMYGQTDVLTFETGYWDLSNGATKTSLVESQSKRRLVGLFGDMTLGWDEIVYLNLTARNDWSSTLPIGNNSYFYPGATLSWNFSEMFKKNDIFTFGKVRVAYGKTGNDASPYYTSARFVQGYANGYYGSDIALFPMNGINAFQAASTIGSSSLRPEMTTESEVGLNLQFFNGRLGLDAAYYDRITSDQIFTLPVDPSSGYSYMVTNFGEVQNRGIELLLNTTPIQTRNFRWDLDFNFAINKNKVLSMPESLEGGKVTINSFSAGNDAVYMYAEEGKPMGTYYTYLPLTVTDKNSPYYGCPIVDEAGQPVLSEEVLSTGRDMNHKWTGGVSTSISAYGFTLSAALDVRYGGTMFSRSKNLMQFTGNGIVTTYNDRKPFIIPNSVVDNGDGTYSENTTPIFQGDGSYQTFFNDYGWGNGGEAYLVDRSFAKLRNVSLTWNLPKKWLRPLTVENIAITAFGNNLFMWTAADNYYVDPESTTEGTDLSGTFGELYTNPSCRVFGCNLSIKF